MSARGRCSPAPRIIERLESYWLKVRRGAPDECWLWLGSCTDKGYGQIWSGETRGKTTVTCLATHLALLMDGVPRPTRKHVAMHSCDNPRCVNPAHLTWGTNADNVADAINKGRILKHHSGKPARALRPHANGRGGKLTADRVRYIRASAATGLELAAELGVSDQCIYNVRSGRTWRHVR